DQLPLTLDKVIVAEDDGSLISGIKKDPQRSEIQAKITLCPTGDADHMLDRGRSKLNLEIDTGKLKDVFDFLFRIIREGKVSDQATSKLGKAIAGDAFSNKIIPWSPNDKIKIDVNLNKVDLFMEPGSEFCGYPTVHSISTITSESGTGMKNLLDIYNDQRTLGTQTAEQGVISLILAGNEGNPLYVKHLVDMVLKDLGLDFERLVPARMKTALETKDTRKVAISIELTTALEGETAVLKAIVQRSYQEKTGWRKWEDVNLPTETIPLSIGKDDIKAYLNKYTLNIDEMIKIFDTMKKNKDEPNEEFSLRKGEITVLNLGITKLTINWKIEPKRNGGEHFEFNSLGVMSVGLDTDIPLEKGTGLTDCCVAVFPTGLYSNSIYMLREENEGRSGIAYQFLPDMAFQEPVERTFKSKTEQQIIRVYTDQDIEDCNLQVLSETTNPVDIEGTTIDTPDLTFTIPPFATSERKDITIRKIMLDCPSCTNGIQDSDEEGVDCGGSCMTPCENCFNGIMDSNEEGIDCGGACIIELDIEELPGLDQNHDCITTEPKYDSCYTDQDCIGSCKEGLTPICSNYTELCTCVKEEVCGNHFCEFYENLGQTCDEDCSQPNCNDYIQNQDETAVDEGGICGLAPSEIDEIKNERFSDIQTLICTGDCSSPSNILKLEDNIKIIVSNPVKALTRGYYEDQWGMRENIHFVNNAAVFHTKTPGTYKAVILISKAGYDDYSETLYFSVNEQTLNTWLIIIPLLIIIIALIAGVVIWTRHKQNTIPK
ncbi:MAG: hypothetical protein KJ601_05605, partial [Nanoarchaeota archaeon]|nr:hypothetical protein [Nanoarchaeota archaeon]